MDFGAIQCTPQSPHCTVCPLMESCEAFRSGKVGNLPVKLKNLKVCERHLVYVYIRCQGETAIHRRGAGDIWQGLWEPYSPTILSEGKDGLTKSSDSEILNVLGGIGGTLISLRRDVKHVLTHRVLYADFYLLETDVRPELPSDYIWIPETQLGDYAVPRLIEILLESL